LSCAGIGRTLGPATLEDQQSRVEAATTTPRLQPGEKIRILVFGESSLTGDYEIDQSGFVSLPLAGTVKAAGSTQPELEKELAKEVPFPVPARSQGNRNARVATPFLHCGRGRETG